ncbi:MAG: hypothetical protein ACRD0U_02000 [Acidimicrobiales bacterium]
MLFEVRFRDPIADGSVTVTFRRWKRRQAVAGRRYRTMVGIIEVDSVDVVDEADISAADAAPAGYESVAALVADLRGTPDLPLYRIRFNPVPGPDPRDELAGTAQLSAADIAELDRRLDRLDRASPHGPWTASVLAAIDARPATRAADLAASFGRETQPFKIDVRKLKNLGLTLSLDVGYRLSPRGEAYLRIRGQPPPA